MRNCCGCYEVKYLDQRKGWISVDISESSNIWASYRQHDWNDAREISHISLFVLMLQTGI